MTAAIYTVGSDIERQLRTCRAFATSRGVDVTEVFSDASATAFAALTEGASGVAALRDALRSRRVDVVVLANLARLADDLGRLEPVLVDLLRGSGGARCFTADGLTEFGPVELDMPLEAVG